jgi:small GTP-binding protein
MQAIKCVVIGDEAVGKTSLLISYTTNQFPTDCSPTVIDNYSGYAIVDGKTVHLGLWDSAGREDSDRFRPLMYPQTDIFFVCYSIASPSSYSNVMEKYVPEIKHHCPNTPFFVVGLKTDLRQDADTTKLVEGKGSKILTPEDGDELAKRVGANQYIECSAKLNEGLKLLFDEAIRCAISTPKKKKSLGCNLM